MFNQITHVTFKSHLEVLKHFPGSLYHLQILPLLRIGINLIHLLHSHVFFVGGEGVNILLEQRIVCTKGHVRLVF